MRYKDYRLAARPVESIPGCDVERNENPTNTDLIGLHETQSVKVFWAEMQKRGVYHWWQKAMGYAGDEQQL